jgi:hypothetical protein
VADSACNGREPRGVVCRYQAAHLLAPFRLSVAVHIARNLDLRHSAGAIVTLSAPRLANLDHGEIHGFRDI